MRDYSDADKRDPRLSSWSALIDATSQGLAPANAMVGRPFRATRLITQNLPSGVSGTVNSMATILTVLSGTTCIITQAAMIHASAGNALRRYCQTFSGLNINGAGNLLNRMTDRSEPRPPYTAAMLLSVEPIFQDRLGIPFSVTGPATVTAVNSVNTHTSGTSLPISIYFEVSGWAFNTPSPARYGTVVTSLRAPVTL